MSKISENISSFQDNHDRRWFFKKWQFKFQRHAMHHLFVVDIQWIFHIEIVEKTFSKRITLFVRYTISTKSRIKYRWKKIVEKSKIEFFFVFVSFVKFLDTYENKLSNLNTWLCFEFKNVMIVAKFNDIHVWIMTRCMKCSIKLFDSIEKSLKNIFNNHFNVRSFYNSKRKF